MTSPDSSLGSDIASLTHSDSLTMCPVVNTPSLAATSAADIAHIIAVHLESFCIFNLQNLAYFVPMCCAPKVQLNTVVV